METVVAFLLFASVLSAAHSSDTVAPPKALDAAKANQAAPAQLLKEEDPLTDDRININVNRGHAEVHGAGGGSVSDSLSKGVQVGIRRPGMADQTLYQKTDSYGSSHTYGQRPPTASTGAYNQIANGANRGGATASFSGGQGIAQTDSISQHVEIPLDAYGTVLFSNLKESPHGAAAAAKTTGHKQEAKKTHDAIPNPKVPIPNPHPKKSMNIRPEI